VQATIPDAHVDVLYANLDYVDWITDRIEFAADDYQYYSLDSYFLGCGDWVFAEALYADLGPNTDSQVVRASAASEIAEFERYLSGKGGKARLGLHRRLREYAPDFVRNLAERIVAAAPDVVGFTSTFQQSTAALATARAVKHLSPEIVTIMGGANCDGAQGEAVHRNFPFLDAVIRGEGEVTFPRFLRALRGDDDMADIPGLCWRRATGTPVVNPMSVRPLPPGEIVAPNFDGYLERLDTSVARTWVEPKLVVEGARGCWWGEKHHCTFCGLNGSFMEFRSKSPTRLYDEIVGLVRRYQVLDLFLVDNILDMAYLNTLLPRFTDSGYDLRMQVEIKSNLRREQLQTLHDAGVVSVQPGVENLNSRVLKLMDKGVTGCHNVRLLRDATSVGQTVLWNYLYGFPGECEQDYSEVIDQMPALHHLPPPSSSARIEIERFSPYFNQPEMGFTELRPALQYRLTYHLPEHELYDLAYIFEGQPRGIGDDTAAMLDEGLAEWRRAYPGSRLTYWELGEEIVLASERRSFGWTTLHLTDPCETAAFRLFDQPRTLAGLVRKLPDVREEAVTALVRRWHDAGLLYADGGQYVHIATAATNSELLKIGGRQMAEMPRHTLELVGREHG
jgi:ribosomal peptide maturation radical SAM protein 1